MASSPPGTRWTVVLPMKRMDCAKSRIDGTPAYRRQLAILMARDTLCAVVNAESVDEALVVCQREEDVESFALPGVRILVRPDLDANQAIQAGADLLRAETRKINVACLPGDLPYLRSTELDVALRLAGTSPRSVVGDRRATGTTLLTARAGAQLRPAYGDQSLRRHEESGATELSIPAWSGLRHDVDVASDLVANMSLGRRTRALLQPHPAPGILA